MADSPSVPPTVEEVMAYMRGEDSPDNKPSIPPSVQAWDEAKQKGYIAEKAAGDALRAEVLRLTEELMAAKNSADFYRDLDNERSGKVRSLRAENLRLREALEQVCDVGDRAAVSAARAALGSVSSEPPREAAVEISMDDIDFASPEAKQEFIEFMEREQAASSEPPEEAER